jgi:endonuclease/exonuclease/phosphatase family metal-dependent hydrolase
MRLSVRLLVCSISVFALSASAASAQTGDIVVYTSGGKVTGNWSVVADTTAAGGKRLANPNAGAAKRTTALASPTDYFELTFDAQGGVGYRLWMRGKAESDYYGNDSAYVQFSDSVSATGAPQFRIGTTSATVYTVEDCSGCGVSDWGWNDNYYGTAAGELIYFQNSGSHTVRIQVREDGLSLDQFVLSPSVYAAAAPGAPKNDTVILDETATTREVVLHASDARTTGNWSVMADTTAAGGQRLSNVNKGAAKLTTPLAAPNDYFELTFNATAGIPYHLWMRGKADSNYYGNDSAYVQFSDSVSETGTPQFRIGTTSATTYTVEDCNGCGVSGWGWNDNYYGAAPGENIYFQTTGTHTIRVQIREDGLSLDQIVLSSETYLTTPPGAPKDDTTILGSDVLSSSSGSSGATGGGTVAIEGGNLAPVFASGTEGFRIAQVAPALPVAPATVFISASATGPEATDTLTYTYDVGDGTSPVTTSPSATEQSRQNVVHTYTAAGNYTARVTVTDQAGNTATRTAAIAIGAPVATTPGQQLKVMQWNTYKTRTTDTRTEGSKVWLFARWIAAANPDVVQLQEVTGSNIAKKYAAELQQLTGRTWHYFYKSDYGKDSTTAQGIAILTPLDVISTASHAYVYCPNAQVKQRAAIAVTVNVNGRNVTLVDTHLSSYSGSADEACRYQQSLELTSWMDSMFGDLRILTGDLNADPAERTIKHFTTTFDDTWADAVAASRAIAYPDNLPNGSIHTRSERIDYVMAAKTGRGILEVVAEQVPDTRDFTNHNSIYAQGKTSWAPHNYAPRVSDHETIIATFVVH